MMLSEFKPALRFLGIFLGLYFLLNLVYGIWIESLGNQPDVATYWVSQQSARVLESFGYKALALNSLDGPTVRLMNQGTTVLRVFEGCNGINVGIVFLSFMVAFGGPKIKMIWFIPAGLIIIHLANLVRVVFLYWLADQQSGYFYYFHKYFFTAAIYAVVFLLWGLWVTKWSEKGDRHAK